MKIIKNFFDEFKRGKYMPLTPKIKNKAHSGCFRITRICIHKEKGLLYFIRFFKNKDYKIRYNPKGQYWIIIMNMNELSKDEWKQFLEYVRLEEEYEETQKQTT